ncbi:hypothetical protein A3715_02525 [Oleiphilus sp. HI0009]|nr:hypothetical protein A3715_02525 [Oleiphilus sp. HI0009]MCH2158741.1 exodeoxyribonuclease V subunit alpha [Oleiphilaceae bacterium]
MSLPSNISQRLRFLKQSLRRGESLVSWIDFYAADAALNEVLSGSDSELPSTLLEVVFDLALVLSYASGLGKQCVKLDELDEYLSLTVFHRDQSLMTSTQALPESILSSGEGSSVFVKVLNDEAELYLRRLWNLCDKTERWLSGQLSSNISSDVDPNESIDLARGKEALNALFPDLDSTDIDYQVWAVAQSLLSNLVLVSGGPGTGKTTTAAKIILARLSAEKCIERAIEKGIESRRASSTVCLAPTGKAAQRLASSLSSQAESLLSSLPFEEDLIQHLRSALPKRGKTVHRYLIENDVSMSDFDDDDYLSDNERLFGKLETSAIPNVLVIDESSMIDLALMERLSTILHPQTCVVLLGDHYQLPAVEAGDVFARWVKRCKRNAISAEQLGQLIHLLPFDMNVEPSESEQINPLVTLQKSYRFHGALADVARLIRDEPVEALRHFLTTNTDEAIRYHWVEGRAQQELGALMAHYQDFVELAETKASLAELQKCFDQFQILCSTRQGPLGTDQLNEAVHTKAQSRFSSSRTGVYHGMPIMLERNYPKLDLYNGDLGFYIENVNQNHESQFVAMFYRGGEGRDITVLPSQIDKYDLAYAMTVHKSQGSEYDHVGVVLAPYAPELLTRALLYTAVTRAKQKCTLYLNDESLDRLMN